MGSSSSSIIAPRLPTVLPGLKQDFDQQRSPPYGSAVTVQRLFGGADIVGHLEACNPLIIIILANSGQNFGLGDWGSSPDFYTC